MDVVRDVENVKTGPSDKPEVNAAAVALRFRRICSCVLRLLFSLSRKTLL